MYYFNQNYESGVKILYEKIKKLCENRNISVTFLESKLGFARSSICKWDVNSPSIARIKAVADYFKISVDELIGGDVNE